MAPLIVYLMSSRKVLLLYLVLFLFTSLLLSASSSSSDTSSFLGTRRMLEVESDQVVEDDPIPPPKKKIATLSSKNQTKLIKSNLFKKNQTSKLIEDSLLLSKNQTKLTKSSNSTKSLTTLSKNEFKKLNSTSNLKKLNSTSELKKKHNSTSIKPISSFPKKSSDLLKLGSSKNKTSTSKDTQIQSEKKNSDSESKKQPVDKKPITKKTTTTTSKVVSQKQPPSWLDQEMEDDLVAEFRDLPSKFQQTLLPDLERFSITSKKYISKANKEMTKGFKPIVGTKYASTIATVVSFAFITIPLLLVSLVFNRIKACFSIQKIVIFIQVYLSIYFSILCLSSLVTGLEPLRFFYATSQSTYICLMVLQTLGYVLYLLLLLMYLILVFSTESGMGSKLLGLGQIFVGFAIGLHFYMAVFHRVVLHQPPKTNWKIHGIYATCFLVICLLARFDRRKKAYLEDGGEEGKKN